MNGDQLDQLLVDFCDGTINDADLAAFSDWVRDSPENARTVAALSALNYGLTEFCKECAASELMAKLEEIESAAVGSGPVDITEELARREKARQARVQSAPIDYSDSEPRIRQIVIPKSLFYGSIAAALLLCVFLVSMATTGNHRDKSTAEDTATQQIPQEAEQYHAAKIVGRVIDSRDAEWTDEVPPSTFLAGDSAELIRGFVELEFARGARVLIEGPCHFTVQDDNSMLVTSGRLVAEVPPGARLFAIDTPSARVLDFGTEFGLNVDPDGQTEVAVFQGLVELSDRSERSGAAARHHSLATGQMSRVLSDTGLEDTVNHFAVNTQSTFIRRMKDADNPAIRYARAVRSFRPVVYWPLRGEGEILRDALGSKRYDLKQDGAPLSRWSPGPESLNTRTHRTDTLAIDGQRGFYFAESFPSDTWQDNEYSIVMWMRVDELRQQNVVAMVEELDTRNLHFTNQIRLNADGQLEHYAFFPVSQNPGLIQNVRESIASDQKIQTDRWVHVVSTYGEGWSRLYLDGRLVAEKHIGLRFETNYSTLVIGASTGLNHIRSESLLAMPEFNGSLCDLAVFNRMLRSEEVANLFDSPAPSW